MIMSCVLLMKKFTLIIDYMQFNLETNFAHIIIIIYIIIYFKNNFETLLQHAYLQNHSFNENSILYNYKLIIIIRIYLDY